MTCISSKPFTSFSLCHFGRNSTPLAASLPWKATPMASTGSKLSFLGDSAYLSFDPLRDSVRIRRGGVSPVVVSAGNAAAPSWESWKPEKTTAPPSLSDVIWPAAGAFATMAIMGKIDQILGPKGISISVAPLGAVSSMLYTTPSAPAARKYNIFMAQIGCAAIGVIALTILGPGWLARSSALAASVAFMVYARANHPPAASLPLMFIDGTKFHNLGFWYALFPGAAGCVVLCLLQEIVCYMKEKFKF